MKGISLSIQTVVIFILAAAVVGIILVFLVSGTSETMDVVTAKGEQARLCNAYAVSHNCEGEATPELQRVCAVLKDEYPACASSQDLACIHECCELFCGEVTVSTTETGGCCQFDYGCEEFEYQSSCVAPGVWHSGDQCCANNCQAQC